MYSEKVFHDFLSNTEFTENEISVLMLAYSNANGITAPQVAESLGYKHFLTANGIVGRLGKKLAAQVSDVNIDDKSIQWWTLLFSGVRTLERGFVWKLHKNLRKALDSISDGVDELYSANKNKENNPNPIDSNELIKQDLIKEQDNSYYEGKRHNLILNTYERNAKARLACIKYYGTHCQVCGFDFERVYGSIGSGYVQVHHLKPLSEIGEEYKVDPIKDLIPVCSNCHSMIHRREKPYSIEELQNIVNANREEK